MNTEQERAFIEWRTNHDPRKYPAERDAFMAGWDAGRAALQSQDKEDAERYRRLRKGDIDDVAVVQGLGAMDYGASAVIATYSVEIDGDDLDAAIDHARRAEGDGE